MRRIGARKFTNRIRESVGERVESFDVFGFVRDGSYGFRGGVRRDRCFRFARGDRIEVAELVVASGVL